MGRDFFERLDADLAALTREGAHLIGGNRVYGRAARHLRRGLAFALVSVALAAAFVSEFPASASGHVEVARAPAAQRL
jgi:hypothetical protein